MGLPPKTIQVDHEEAHLIRTIPPLVEGWLADIGYCVRPLSMLQQEAVRASTEGIKPLDEATIRELAGERADELLQDMKAWRFEKEADGTFVRGDIRFYVQGIEARDQIRKRNQETRDQMESVEHVFDKVDEWNHTLNKDAKGVGRFSPELSQVAPVSAHASGGAAEKNRTRLAERLAGKTKE